MGGRSMTVCVVGGGGREHALALALARVADVVVTPGNPGMPAVTDRGAPDHGDPGPARGGRGRPGGDRPRGAAGRRPGRPPAGPGPAGGRPGRRRGPAGGLQGVHEGAAGRGRGAHRPLRRLRPGGRGRPVPPHACPGPGWSRPTGWPPARACWWPASLEEAEADVAAKLSGGAFGEAGRRVVIEEGLAGPECSLLVLCDGRRVVPLAPAQDFKRLADGDAGPNTGGMGAYSPVPEVDDDLVDRLMDEAVEPLVAALRAPGDRLPRGALRRAHADRRTGPRSSSTTSASGTPRPRWCCPGWPTTRSSCSWRWPRAGWPTWPATGWPSADDAAVCVVLAAEGYPADPPTGRPHRRPGPRRPAGRTGARGDGLPRRHPARRSRRRRSSPPAGGCSA